jgi:hypothetical protein
MSSSPNLRFPRKAPAGGRKAFCCAKPFVSKDDLDFQIAWIATLPPSGRRLRIPGSLQTY